MVYFLCKAYDSDRQNCYFAQSLPVRGAWIEILRTRKTQSAKPSRSPCGERGLKSIAGSAAAGVGGSLPVRGAWIEIICVSQRLKTSIRRSPCGERGLKLRGAMWRFGSISRSPCGERGLKSWRIKCSLASGESLPVRGAWIEIPNVYGYGGAGGGRSPCGERGLK